MVKRVYIDKFIFIIILCFLSAPFFKTTAEASSLKSISILDDDFPSLKAALSNANWQELKNTLLEIRNKQKDIPTCNIDAPLRFLYGHSALATGENSVAVKQFYCPLDNTNMNTLENWLDWTRNLAAHDEYSKWTISHYLYGDALARSGELESAKKEFNRALEIDSKNILALNARGVVNWLLYEASKADENHDYDIQAADDFIGASEINPNFADAFANRGIINLRAQGDLSQAGRYFGEAREIDPTYWLAANGQAVVYGASGEYWKFLRMLDEIEKKAPNTPFFKINRNDYKDKSSDDLNPRGMTSIDTWQRIGKSGLEAMQLGGLANFADVASKEFGDLIYNRGGIFVYVKEGENLKVTKEGSPRLAGTWFALNYPQSTKTK